MKQKARALVGLIVGMALFSASSAQSAEAPVQLQLDTETAIDGVGVACTGIGQTKTDPRWLEYPVRVEFANTQHEYVIGVTVTLSDSHGTSMLAVSCPGPWLVLKLPDRSAYRLDAHMSDANTPLLSRTVVAPAHGQSRVVLTFPGM